MTERIIDYSQYSSWMFCPWKWYEHYVACMGPQRTGQRSDPLCLGSLVHNGLDNFVKLGKPVIDAGVIEEMTPTPEAYATAQLLLEGYIAKYPGEQWEVERTEEPVKFPLVVSFDDIPSAENAITFHGLAKFDGYFYVPEDTTIESGLPGETLRLSRGWWSREYKTKAWGSDRAKWIRDWTTKKQADFQMLALQGLIGKPVQGVLVSVLEKPREYTPRRKCITCKETWDMAAYFPTGEGVYACPSCGSKQKLSPYEPKAPKVPEFYRITATRTQEQLEESRREITQVALAMEDMRQRGRNSIPPNRDNCEVNKYHRTCEYWAPHTYGNTVEQSAGFVQIDPIKYLGLPEAA